ncbi:Cyclic nucleotide-binding domain-containing protein 2 [Exaiptasia diaphana]|nr:Cyclic nucleotide-binding domain-containing protein 2 [Exaiptasia diaphana]
MLLQKFRHAVRLVSIFSTFCMGIRRYAEQEKSTEYDLYYLRDMLPDNEDKPTPVQEASLYFNKHLFSRDNTLHFPFWARWTCALDPSDRTDAEIHKLVTLLRGMKSFNKFSRHAQWHLCRTMTYARYEKRRIIIRQGHPGFCFYFIVSGTVSVTVTRCDLKTGIYVTNTVDVLEKNDSFGEIALMTPDARRTATIICRERVEVLVVNRETVMEHCPDVFQRDFDEKFNVLRGHDIFKRWSNNSLKKLCFESHIKELAHGKLVDPDSTKSEAVYFIIKGKVDMLRRLDISAVIASKVSIRLYETKPLPRPSSAIPGKGKPQIEFVNVGSLTKNDSWDLRIVFTEGFAEPGNILVSAGVRLLKVPKQRILQMSPLGALDEFSKSFVLSHRSPTVDELYQEYMAAQSWIEYRQKVVQNVLDCKRGNHVAHMSSVTKGTSGWGPWPAKAAKNLKHE